MPPRITYAGAENEYKDLYQYATELTVSTLDRTKTVDLPVRTLAAAGNGKRSDCLMQ